MFDPQAKEAAQFGDAVHAVFEQIEWYTDAAKELLDGDSEAVAMVRTCLKEPEIQGHFTTDPEAVVWRERRFGVVLDGEFCSGVFDRVVLWPDRAEIVDFKTDIVRDSADVELAVCGINPNWIGTGACGAHDRFGFRANRLSPIIHPTSAVGSVAIKKARGGGAGIGWRTGYLMFSRYFSVRNGSWREFCEVNLFAIMFNERVPGCTRVSSIHRTKF